MKLQRQRNASHLLSRRKRTLLPTPTDHGRRIWPPGRLLLLLLLLLLLCALQRASGSTEAAIKIDFDLAPNSFDDQYQGCRKQVMEELNQGDYFTEEIYSHKSYSRVWQKAHIKWLGHANDLPKHMTPAHAVAVLVYILNDSMRSHLSNAMASAATSPQKYKQSFHFKYLHYYLTSAIQLLREELIMQNGTECYEVHHKMKDVHFSASTGATVRFGQFLSTSLLRAEAPTFGSQTVFTILTCLGAPIQDFSLKKEVLIPPYELFKVVNMSYHPKGQWLYLQSAGNLSTYNCQLLKASSKNCSPAPIVIASLSFLVTAIISSKRRV